MKAISDKADSQIPSFGYPVPYALSTIVFLIYGYLFHAAVMKGARRRELTGPVRTNRSDAGRR
jgi:hypothetical protein